MRWPWDRKSATSIDRRPIDEMSELAAETRRLAQQLTNVAVRLRRDEEARDD